MVTSNMVILVQLIKKWWYSDYILKQQAIKFTDIMNMQCNNSEK